MRLVTYLASGEARVGAMLDSAIVDLNRADPELPSDMLALLRAGPARLERLRRAVADAVSDPEAAAIVPVSDATLLAPIPRPPKIVCIGVNYADHAAEAGRDLPAKPSVFLKAPSTVVGPGAPIVRPPTTAQLDYEVELAVVIGQPAKAVPRDRALDYVAGYTILNDVSARDLQLAKDGGVIVGKNFDEFWTQSAHRAGCSPQFGTGIPGPTARP